MEHMEETVIEEIEIPEPDQNWHNEDHDDTDEDTDDIFSDDEDAPRLPIGQLLVGAGATVGAIFGVSKLVRFVKDRRAKKAEDDIEFIDDDAEIEIIDAEVVSDED